MDKGKSRLRKGGIQPRLGTAERDVIALGIAAAAIIFIVGKSGVILPQLLRWLAGFGIAPGKMLVNALLFNVVLIIFGWRRYRQLSAEVR